VLASSAESMASSRAAPAAPGELDLFSFACPDGELYEVTEAFAGLLGVTGGDINGRTLPELVAPEDRAALSHELAALSGDARQASLESRFVQSDGHVIYVQWVARRMAGSDLWRAAGTDAADLVKLLADRRDLRTRLDLAIGQATAAMWDLDLRQDRFTWESQAAQILGVSPEAIPTNAAQLAEVVHAEDRHVMAGALRRLVEEGATEVGVRVGQDAEVRYLSMRGRILDADSDGQTRRAVGLLLDVTTEKAMEEQLLRMSASDALTGTPNRRAFDQALRGEWRRCTRAREPLTLIMVDIDGFKQFNDTFGHLVGDQALIAVARALAGTLHREGDLLARYGGEEFAIVLPNTDTDGALVLGQQLAEAVRGITIRQALGWNLSVSVGTASWHPDRELMKSPVLLGRADEALYAAKTAGKNRVIAYEETLAARDTLQAAIAEGLKQSEFELHYQPLINLDDGHLVGFEALMRWNRPGHGLVAPHAFIPIAETTTLICDLGRWALQTAACQLAAWSRQGLDVSSPLRVAVNVSARHAAAPAVVTDVQVALATSGIAPEQLELELTETALQHSTAVRAQLARVRSLGVSVAIDDFGTGYTSITELAHMPADVLKIDRTFITSPDPRQSNLIKLIIEAAHAFDLRVVAEGIEEEHTLDTMRDLDCDTAQGYLIARPMPAEQVPNWITRHQRTERHQPQPSSNRRIVSAPVLIP
jgi:diguanylate cyclase (GGDEF)-like protein/PAS domain S-box-containing protein